MSSNSAPLPMLRTTGVHHVAVIASDYARSRRFYTEVLGILAEVQRKPRLVVVAENHSVVGGLGEAVASALLQNGVQPARFRLAGLPDAYLDAGALPTLHDRYGISTEALSARVKAWLQ